MIEINNLTKTYRQRDQKAKANGIFDVCVRINSGETLALVGPNGSGKSTLLKCLCGVVYPQSGKVLFDGRSPHAKKSDLCYEMGVIFSAKTGFIEDLPVEDNFELVRRLYGMERNVFSNNLDELNEFLDTNELKKRQYRVLSRGQRLRCELAACLAHAPTYIILDEPTLGIDAGFMEGVKRCLHHIQKKSNMHIIICSHDFDFLNAVCNRAIIMDNGRISNDMSFGSFYKEMNSCKRVTVTTRVGCVIPQVVLDCLKYHYIDEQHISYLKKDVDFYSPEVSSWLTSNDVLSIDTAYRSIEEVFHEK